MRDPNFDSLTSVLRHRATHEPDRTAYIFLQDGELETAVLTYAALDRRARAIAAQLQSRSRLAERALLLYPPGLDFVEAFWGCLYAGVIAVPSYPPRPGQSLARLQRVASDAKSTTALTVSAKLLSYEQQAQQTEGLATLGWLATDSVPDELADQWQPAVTGRESLALLQYTSGSTGVPKGVMVSHGNVLHNSEYLRQCFELTAKSVSVTWLPSFHDMGLVDGILQPVYTGFTGVILPSVAFLQSPIRWLQAITRYGGTHGGGPNFGYELCVRKITPQQRATLDLRTWVSAYNGAEPVHHTTLAHFAEYFQPAGFQPHYFYPCYGMAESTLIITGGRIQAEPKIFAADADALEAHRAVAATGNGSRVRSVVGCGQPWLDTRVEIVDPDRRLQCPPDQIGEIWTAGPSVAQGYWHRPTETEATFGARLADSAEGPFLRTGDLGFVHDGELYVTGRIKDVIIIRGLNYYPQDIEQTARASYPGLRPGGGAAFSIEASDEEHLVVVQEVDRLHLRRFDAHRATMAIRKAIVDEFGIQAHSVVFIRPATLPKTSSGKTQRQMCRQQFLDNALEVLEASSKTS